jgi:hypothetical protein
MLEDIVICCNCDEQFHKEETHRINMAGLEKDFYICNSCLSELPKLSGNVIEPSVKKNDVAA